MKNYSSETVYFATWERPDMHQYKNKEYRLKLSSGNMVMPDFIDLEKKKIIEFDGDYWHNGVRANKKKEEARQKMIMNDNFSVLRVREHDYNKDPQSQIHACLNFLTE